MFTVENYIDSIKTHLEKQSGLVEDQLQKIFSYPFSKDIEVLDFTAFIEPTRFELSVIMFSMDKEANEVFNEGNDSTVFAGSEDVLQEVEYHQMNDSQLDVFLSFMSKMKKS